MRSTVSEFCLARVSHKKVDHASEDAGFPNSNNSEYYIIGNPGEGLHKQQTKPWITGVKPERSTTHSRSVSIVDCQQLFHVNYTYSRLFGNYSALKSDEEGRLSRRLTAISISAGGLYYRGRAGNGRLPTEGRTLKFYGAYRLSGTASEVKQRNEFNLFTTVQSGTL